MRVAIKQKNFETAVLRKNLTYKDLAEKLGVSKVYLSSIKNETLPNFRPSAEIREKLMKILDKKFDYLFKIECEKKERIKKEKIKLNTQDA